MYSGIIPGKKIKKDHLENSCRINDCKVSKASTEIMLDRSCNGKEIEFPFQNN